MRFSRILTCSAIVAMGSMLAWGARPASSPSSNTAAVTAVQQQGGGYMQQTPDQQADGAINRAKQNGLSDADATAAKTPLVTYYTASQKLRQDAMANNTRPDPADMQKLRTQLSDDLTKAGVSADGIKTITASLGGRGRRGGGGGGGGF